MLRICFRPPCLVFDWIRVDRSSRARCVHRRSLRQLARCASHRSAQAARALRAESSFRLIPRRWLSIYWSKLETWRQSTRLESSEGAPWGARAGEIYTQAKSHQFAFVHMHAHICAHQFASVRTYAHTHTHSRINTSLGAHRQGPIENNGHESRPTRKVDDKPHHL